MVTYLPRHFQAYNENSLIYKFLDVIGESIEVAEVDLNNIMLSKWLSTADKTDIERLGRTFGIYYLPNEDLPEHRIRIKRTIYDLINGRSTPASICAFMKSISGIDLEIIENPVIENDSGSLFIRSGDKWELFCNSVEEAKPMIYIRGITNVRNPRITNIRTNESVEYQGLLRKGTLLKISAEGGGWLTGINVTDKIIFNADRDFKIPKGKSEWQYTDSNAFFNYAKFNHNVFAEVNASLVEVKINWFEHEPAVVMVRVKMPENNGNNISKTEIEDILEMVRPAGVKFVIEFSKSKITGQ
jgi:hypothetical protein